MDRTGKWLVFGVVILLALSVFNFLNIKPLALYSGFSEELGAVTVYSSRGYQLTITPPADAKVGQEAVVAIKGDWESAIGNAMELNAHRCPNLKVGRAVLTISRDSQQVFTDGFNLYQNSFPGDGSAPDFTVTFRPDASGTYSLSLTVTLEDYLIDKYGGDQWEGEPHGCTSSLPVHPAIHVGGSVITESATLTIAGNTTVACTGWTSQSIENGVIKSRTCNGIVAYATECNEGYGYRGLRVNDGQVPCTLIDTGNGEEGNQTNNETNQNDTQSPPEEGQMNPSSTMPSNTSPSSGYIYDYGPWLLGAAAILLVILFLRRRA